MSGSQRRDHRMARARTLLAPAALAAALVATAALSVTAGTALTAQPVARQAQTTSTVAPVKVSAVKTGTAKVPGWRVVATFPLVGETFVNGAIAANSASAAWSVWTAPGFTAVYRWTASAWAKVPLSSKAASFVRSAVAFDGDSAGDFWMFGGKPAEALRWTGGAWKFQAIPAWVLQKGAAGDTAAVFGPANVWVFSLGAGAYAAHYNGHTWAKVKLPAAVGEVSVVAANDLWALAKNVALHWNGRAWAVIKIPAAPGKPPASFGELSATGADSAWVWRTLLVPGPPTIGRVLHWNGKTWQSVAGLPADEISSAVPDGAGGLWATGGDINPGGFNSFYHLTGGHWTQVATPAGVFNHEAEYLTWIPGSRSLWGVAAGMTTTKGKVTFDSVILKYGP
jgi:hypothetical protein